MSGGVFRATVDENDDDVRSEFSIPDETTEENYNMYAKKDPIIRKKTKESKEDNDAIESINKEGRIYTNNSKSQQALTLTRENVKNHSKILKGIRLKKSRGSFNTSGVDNAPQEAIRDDLDGQHKDLTSSECSTRTQTENSGTVDSFVSDTIKFKQQSLIERAAKGPVRRPVYDVMNTSTSLILLNNRHGKKSRLWKNENFDKSGSRQLINPERHTRATPIYLHGGFHTRCTTSECPERFTSAIKPRLEFNDRPLSDKIGDHLYEARLSVNPHRHRRCTRSSSLNADSTELLSVKSTDKKLYNITFPWQQIYSQPLVRPSTQHSTKYGITSANLITRVPWGASRACIKTAS